MRDVVAGGRIDPVERLQKNPVAAEIGGDLGEVGAIVAGEAVAQLAPVVARVGMIEAGLALERGLAPRRALLAQRGGEQPAAHRTALPHRTAAPAKAPQ